MSSAKPVVNDIQNTLERHRARLEASLVKLRKALRQWQTYSAEYEGLKEELQELPADASKESMIEVGYNFGGTVVDSAEVLSLLGEKSGLKRNRDQVIRAIDHRIDYVTENIKKVEEQLGEGEEKYASLLVVQGPEVSTEDGEPIIEIREEIDEEGNIISSTTQPHGRGKTTSMNIDDLKQFQKYIENAAEETTTPSEPMKLKENSMIAPKETLQEPGPMIGISAIDLVSTTALGSTAAQSISVDEIRLDKVSLKELAPIEAPTGEPTGSPVKMDESPAVEGDVIIPNQQPTGGFVSDANKKVQEEDFVLSVDEPSEAADLRRQMIDYNLHDIGAVVAEIDLEEEDDDNYDDDDEDEDNEEEDEYGRSTSRVITADIEREMQALQARVRERQENEVKKRTAQAQVELPNAAQLRITPDKGEALSTSRKKGVTFSDKLDVSIIPPVTKPDTQPFVLPPPPTLGDSDDAVPFLVDLLAREQMIEDMKKAGLNTVGVVHNDGWEKKTKDEAAAQTKKVSRYKAALVGSTAETANKASGVPTNRAPVLKSTILERQTGTAPAPAPPQAPASDKPKKSSRFNLSRAAESAPLDATTNPPFVGIHENTTLNKSSFDEKHVDEAEKPPRPLVAPTIIEKPPTIATSPENLPMAPSELDPTLHRQEVAVEYFKTRNKMIQREGGFLPREEEEMYVPLDDGRKKMSRFKAAKLGMGQTFPR
ncbi:Prefoldin subunit-domain-containing protein [Terfezia claveryi]|nr:Prefoldin subunit-domain-containing protein [Terfezia claveryi]